MSEHFGASNLVDSTTVNPTSTAPSMEMDPVVHFRDAAPSNTASYAGRALHEDPADPSVSLREYLARPVLIHQGQFLSTDTVGTTVKLDPWHAWISNPGVAMKINNFYRFRGGLQLRMVINGVRQAYGRYALCYVPNPSQGVTGTPPVFVSDFYDRVRLLQNTHALIDPSVNSSPEIEIPYIFHYPWCRIPDLYGADTYMSLGCAYVCTLAPLGYTSSTTTNPVAYSVYAFASSDFEIDVTTPDVAVVQAGEEDHMPTGTFRSTVAAVEGAASALQKIPLLEPFARATQMAASFGLSAASLFGYSKPASADEPTFMVQRNYGLMTSTTGVNAVHRFVADPTAEVPISGGAVGGAPYDELTVRSFAERPGYVAMWAWPEGPQAAPIGAIPVSPNYTDLPSTLDPTLAVPPPISLVSNIGLLWRGSLHYHFSVVSNSFMSGRLAICWFPPQALVAPNYASLNTNNVYTCILDLDSARELDVEISWRTIRPMLETRLLARVVNSTYASHSDYANGTLVVYVVNPLLLPDTTGSATVLVTVSGGDDFELAVPSGDDPFYVQQHISSAVVQAGDGEQERCQLNGSAGRGRFVALNVGERLSSLRPLLKRPCDTSIMYPVPSIGATSTVSYPTVLSPYAAHPGYGYFDYAFLFKRGGMTYYVVAGGGNIAGTLVPDDMAHIAYRTDFQSVPSTRDTQLLIAQASPVEVISATCGGSQVVYPKHGGITLETPSYMRTNGIYCTRSDVDFAYRNSANSGAMVGVGLAFVSPQGQSGLTVDYRVYGAVNDDFTYCVFVGSPLMTLVVA